MTFLSARRMLSACIVSAAAVVALAAPGSASAVNDLGEQCSGANIKGLGSSFQAPAQELWNTDFNASTDTNVLGCAGNTGQGDLKKPTVFYEQTQATKGSGACLKDFGGGATPKYKEYPFCGTDEAPSQGKIEEMEKTKEGGESGKKSIESIPVLQGSVAVLVHLPAGCKAESVVPSGIKTIKLGRLALDNSTVEQIFRGVITTWKGVAEAQTDNSTSITCTGGEAEENTPIKVVVRLDKSGTTHIFKAYLLQVFTGTFEAESFNEINEGAEKEHVKPCGEAKGEEPQTWKKMSEGCENQRWPAAAKITRPTESGNPGVINYVGSHASTITYADLAAARKQGEFSKKGLGGENKKGSETKVGEQNQRFWTEVQNSKNPATTWADPSSDGDIEKLGNSNCASTKYAAEPGEEVPPPNTRVSWALVKSELVQKKYNICGLTYDLALREYKPYFQPKTALEEEEGVAEATTVENYLLWSVNAKTQGGGYDIKNHDYEKLSSTVLKEAETGIKEIGFKSH